MSADPREDTSATREMRQAPIVVVGGGLAGVAAALRLADAGEQVVLVEARGRLGGRAGSGMRHGHPVDTGAHVALRCYTAYRQLLATIGSDHLLPVAGRLDIPVLVDGRTRHLTRTWPLRYAALSRRERGRAVAAGLTMRRVDPAAATNDARSFGGWLADHGQSERAVRRLWGLLGLPALNLRPDEASLAMAAMVFRTAMFHGAHAADLAVPAAPLRDLHDVPVRAALDRLGVRLRLGTRVLSVDRLGDNLVVCLRDRSGGIPEQLRAAGVVLAVPHSTAAQLAPADACPDRGAWSRLGGSPILNAHIYLDRRVLDEQFAAAPDSQVQWLFDRTAAAGYDHGQYLVSSVSAADELIGVPAAGVVERQLRALRQVLPRAREAKVVDAFVTREPCATFRAGPGSGRLRPGAETRWPQLVLAGAWTDTGWPDTLEGAVRSGLTAADRLTARARLAAPSGSAHIDSPAGSGGLRFRALSGGTR